MKKKNRHKILSLLLCTAMLCSAVTPSGFAEDVQVQGTVETDGAPDENSAAEIHEHGNAPEVDTADNTQEADAADVEAGEPETDAADAGDAEADAANAGDAEAGEPEADAANAGGAEAGEPEADTANAADAETGEPETDAANAGDAEAGEPEADAADTGDAEEDAPDMGAASAIDAAEGDPAPGVSNTVVNPDYTKPVITVTNKNPNGGTSYCEAPDIKVTDAGGNLSEITVLYETDNRKVSIPVTNASEMTVEIDSNTGLVTVTAVDSTGNTTTSRFYNDHMIGGIPRGTIPATCTEPARWYQSFLCKVCQKEYNRIERVAGPALGHEYDAEKAAEHSLCGDETVMLSPCKRCGELVNEKNESVISADGTAHDWKKYRQEPTCTEAGSEYEKCNNCDAKRNEKTIPALGHQFSEWKTVDGQEEKCGQKCTQERTCQRTDCGDKETQTVTLDHAWSNVEETLEEATCTEEGTRGYRCTRPECTEIKVTGTTPALGHTYEDDGDCTTPSECARCGEALEAKEHAWGDYQTDGEYHWRACTNDGCRVKETAGHSYDLGANHLCTNSRICKVCGHTTPGLSGHEVEWKSGDGYHWLACKNEGCTYTAQKAVHKVKTDGDCTTADICTVCNAVVQEAMNHKYSAYVNTYVSGHFKRCQNPGCNQQEEKGEHTYGSMDTFDCTKGMTCTVCGYAAYSPATAHNTANSTIEYREDGHYKKCKNLFCKYAEKVENHRGGTATCSTQAECEVCHIRYGDTNAKVHENTVLENVKEATEDEEGYTGDQVCVACGETVISGETVPKLTKKCEHETYKECVDDAKSWKECENCHYIWDELPHVLQYASDETGHWQYCVSCEHATPKVSHIPNPDEADQDCTTKLTCKDCGYVIEDAKESHNFDTDYSSGPNGHYHQCANPNCTQTDSMLPHVAAEDDGDCKTAVVCKDCGYEMSSASKEHIYSGTWERNEKYHFWRCVNKGCTKLYEVEHTFPKDDGNCTTPVACTVCGWVKTPGESAHNFGGDYIITDTTHTQKCQNEGCTATSGDNPHIGGTATCKDLAVCEVCGKSYGAFNPENHAGGTEIRGHIDPTHDEDGYSGDEYCLGCETKLKDGEILSKVLNPDHVFELRFDGTHHWMECRCGTRENYEPHRYEGEWNKDSTHHWRFCTVCNTEQKDEHKYNEEGVCEECGYEQPVHEHTYVWQTDEDGHQQVCAGCGETVNAGTHSYEWRQSDEAHWQACTACGKIINEQKHVLELQHDQAYHWMACTQEGCTYQEEKVVHDNIRDDHDCTRGVVCLTCNAVLVEAKQHIWSESYTFDGEHHWRECLNNDCDKTTEETEHRLIGDKADCTKDIHCEDCGYIARKGEAEHQFEGSPYYSEKDGRVHWRVCQNKDCEAKDTPETHEGGIATCASEAVCSVCHQPYGEKNPANHAGKVVLDLDSVKVATTSESGYTGNLVCDACGEVQEAGEERPKLTGVCDHNLHAASPTAQIAEGVLTAVKKRVDDEKSWSQCDVCCLIVSSELHKFDGYKYDKDGHWLLCTACGYNTKDHGILPHVAENSDHDCTTAVVCKDCGYEMSQKEKEHKRVYVYSEEGHRWICQNPDCSASGAAEPHVVSDEEKTDCTRAEVCEVCGHTVRAALSGHNFATVWTPDADGNSHSRVCKNEGCQQKHTEAHTPGTDDHLCTTPIVCTTCGAITEEAKTHSFEGGKYFTSETGHWRECQNKGCTFVGNEEAHDGAETATCVSPAVCHICGQSYGQVNPKNHTGKVEEKVGYIAPTETTEGYTGNTVCADCGAVIEEGSVIPAGHKHEYTIHAFDSSHHWMECSCGARDDSTYAEHTFGAWQSDEISHWHVCTGCDSRLTEQHTFNEKGQCTVCGVFNHVHQGGEATCTSPAVCEICGTSYGAVNPDHHAGGTEIRGRINATTEAAGYTGDTYCMGCGELIAQGTEIPMLETEPETEEETGEETEEETETKAPATESEKAPEAPRTGDGTQWELMLMLMLLSGSALAAAIASRRRRAR